MNGTCTSTYIYIYIYYIQVHAPLAFARHSGIMLSFLPYISPSISQSGSVYVCMFSE